MRLFGRGQDAGTGEPPGETQEEMDRLSDALSAVPEAEQCAWLKDRFGVSWQITPAALQAAMREGTPAQIHRVVQAFLPMKRLDLAAIRAAYEGAGSCSGGASRGVRGRSLSPSW